MAGFDAAAGIAGLISLGVTAFHGCVQGFIILSTARQLGRDADLLRCMIEWEHYRLYEWSQQAGLGEDGTADLALNWTLILDLLRQLEIQLNDTAKLKARYGLEIEPDDTVLLDTQGQQISKDSSLSKKLSLRLEPKFFVASARAIHEKNRDHYLRRLRWAVIDKAKLEDLLRDVRQILGCLWDVLAFDDRRYIRQSLSRLLRNAVTSAKNDEEISGVSELALTTESDIAFAAQIKRTRLELDTGEYILALKIFLFFLFPGILTHPALVKPEIASESFRKGRADAEMAMDSITVASSNDAKPITRSQKVKALKLKAGLLASDTGSSGLEREVVDYDGQPVLVEFKFLPPDKATQQKLSFRIENLAILLSQMESPSVHILRCLGIIKRNDHYVSVFELPDSTIPATLNSVSPRLCCSLAAVQKFDDIKPDLETRLAWALSLAETMLQLHTAGWVHKSISPEHITFVLRRGPNGHLEKGQYAGPYLSNFEYAREISLTAFSEVQQSVDKENAYRHPLAQGPNKSSFRPQFDVYAFGLVLLELGLWSSTDAILGLTYSEIPKSVLLTATLADIRTKLKFALPRLFVDAVMMALTYAKNGELAAPIEDEEEQEEWLGDDSVDIQEAIATKIRQCI